MKCPQFIIHFLSGALPANNAGGQAGGYLFVSRYFSLKNATSMMVGGSCIVRCCRRTLLDACCSKHTFCSVTLLLYAYVVHSYVVSM